MKKLAAQPNGTLLAHSWGVTNDEPTVIRDVLYVPEKFPGRKVQILNSMDGASLADGFSADDHCHKLSEKWRPRGRLSYLLYLCLRRVV